MVFQSLEGEGEGDREDGEAKVVDQSGPGEEEKLPEREPEEK